MLLPANPISHSRLWKAQVHYLARHFRVVAYDGRGNGRSDFPDPSSTFLGTSRASDCLAVMDATSTEQAVLVGICNDGVFPSIQIAADQPERVLGIVAIAPGVPYVAPINPWYEENADVCEDDVVLADYAGFLEIFFAAMFPEPHSTKQIEDAVAYALDGSAEVMTMEKVPAVATKDEVEAFCRRVRCPVLVMHGDRDNCQLYEKGPDRRGADRRRARPARRRRPHPDGARAGCRQPPDPRLRLATERRAAATPDVDPCRVAPPARVARLLADRPGARLARRRDRA